MSKKILVIDDEPEFRTTIQDVLETNGYHVEGSPYLATSVGWGLTGDFDLITLDLKMPEVDGLEVARLYSRLIPDTNLLVISGYLDKDSVETLEELGISHILAKPAGISDLLKAVDQALSPSYANGTAQNGNGRSYDAGS